MYFLIKKILLKYEEKKYIKRVIAQDSSKIGSLKIKNIKSEIDKSWYSSLNKLTTSLLKTKKDPIYALPWFLVLGNKNSEKFDLLNNIKLSSNIKYDLTSRGNCTWWYFDSIILLSLSSKYLNNGYDLEISKEWEYLITLMNETRKKEPINGIIITISINDLINKNIEELTQETLLIKKRIDELINKFEIIMPIYIFITKMETIYGFNETQEYVNSKVHDSIIGYTNIDYNNKNNIKNNIDASLSYIKNNLIEISKNSFLKQNHSFDKINHFVNEFEIIHKKISNYIHLIFKDNLYQNMPKYRGIYFIGNKSTSDSNNIFTLRKELENKQIKFNKQNINNKAIDNLVKKIIPKDRNIFSYIKVDKGIYLQTFIYSLILVSFLSWFSLSYNQNKNVLNVIKEYQELKTVNNNFNANIQILYQKLIYINKVEKIYKESFFTKFGFNHSKNMLKKIKTEFNINFIRSLLFNFDNYINKTVNKNQLNSSNISILIAYLLQDSNIQQKVIGNKNIGIGDISYMKDILNIKGVKDAKFLEMYYYFLIWNQDKKFVKDRQNIMKKHLKLLLSNKNLKLHWLIDNAITKKENIYLDSFWPNLNKNIMKNDFYVNAAFTNEGKENIKKQINLMKNILGNDTQLAYSINEFWNWYDDLFFNQWKSFIDNFNKAYNFYDYSINRPMLLFTMFSNSSNNNAYKKLIQYFNQQLKSYKNKSIPNWAKEIILLEEILSISTYINKKDDANNDYAILDKIKLKHKEAKSKINSKSPQEYEKLFNDAILLNNYFKALSSLEFIDNNIVNDVSTFFSNDKSSSKLNEVYKQLLKLEFSLRENINEFSYNLIKGPFDFIMHYSINRQACLLNNKWKSDIVLPSKNISNKYLFDELFSNNGMVKNFVRKNLNNYIISSDGKYYRKKIIDKLYYIPFEQNFLQFLTSGAKDTYKQKSEYKVNISTIPISVNRDSKLFPNSSSLTIDCNDSRFTLNNYNYKNNKVFKWEPEKCKSEYVSISIKFKDFTVFKTYKGEKSFEKFLIDFRNGYTRFYLNKDKHIDNNIIKNANLKWIDLNYKISNIDELLKVNKYKKTLVPLDIVECRN
jgi:hypothetical protein